MHKYHLNLVQDGDFWGCWRMGGCKKTPFLKSVTQILQWWNLAQLDLMNHVTHSLTSADITIFSQKISKFCCIKKYRYRLNFSTWFLVLLLFLESLKIFFNKIGYIFDDVSKNGYPRSSYNNGILKKMVMTS